MYEFKVAFSGMILKDVERSLSAGLREMLTTFKIG